MRPDFKKHLTSALVALLLLFAVNRCAVSCNYSGKLRKTEAVVDSLRNIRDSLDTRIRILENDTMTLRDINRELERSNGKLIEKVSNKEIHHWHRK